MMRRLPIWTAVLLASLLAVGERSAAGERASISALVSRTAPLRVPSQYQTIGAAIAAALPGDTILVAPGVYGGATGEVFPLLLPGDVVLRSEAGPFETIVAADAAGTGPLIAARGPSAVSPGTANAGTRLDGFTIAGSGLVDLGLLVDRAGITVEECALTGFTGLGGLGARVIGPGAPTIVRCTIGGNQRGVELRLGVSPTIESNVFVEHDSTAFFCDGSVSASSVRCNVFFANLLDVRGPNASCLVPYFNGTNLVLDPFLCGRRSGDFRVAESSPLFDAAEALACGQVGAFGVGCARPAPILSAIVPDRLFRPEQVEIALEGSYVGPWLLARLEGPQGEIVAGTLVDADSVSARFRFDLAGQSKGDWDVVLADSTGREDRLAGALRVVRAETVAVPGAFATIAAALAAAFAGDTVRVAPGVYGDATGEPAPIRLRAGIALVGSGADVTTIRSRGGVAPPGLIVGAPTVVAALGPAFGGDADSTTILRGIRVDGAGAATWGVLVAGASPTVEECVVVGNRGEATAAGVRVERASPRLARNTIAQNVTGVRVGTVSAPLLEANIVAMNEVGVACEADDAIPVFLCNDFWANEDSVTTRCADPTGADGNAALDPLFCDRLRGDLRIAAASPCAPEGSGGCGRVGALDVGCALPSASRLVVVPEESPTLGDALAATVAGDTVLALPGVYGASERFPLRLRAGRTLRGRDGAGPTRVTAPDGAPPLPVLLDLRGDAATALVGLTLDGGGRVDLLVHADSARGERIDACVLRGATANGISSAAVSGGRGALRVANSLLYGNTNGALAIAGGGILLERTIVARSARYGLFCDGRGEAVAVCCDVWGSGGADYAGSCAELLGILGNLSVDPLFCSEATDDLRLRPESPLATHCTETAVIGPFAATCLARTPAREEGGESGGDNSAAPTDPRAEPTGVTAGALATGGALPERAFLEGPWPSVVAADGRLAFRVGLREGGRARARLVAPSGRLALDLLDRDLPAGAHHLVLDLRAAGAAPLASGVYILVVDLGRDRLAARVVVHR